MQIAIDSAGRIVVPKAMRERLGLGPGTLVELTEREGLVELAAAPVDVRIQERDYGPVLVPAVDGAPLTDADVRAALERVRR